MAEMNTGYTEAKIVLNGYDVSGLDLYNISITTGCVSDNFIGYGATYSPSCSITTSETDIFNTGDLVSVYFKIDENWVDFGTYILSNEPVTTEGQTTIQLEGYLSTVFENEIVSFSGMSEITISEALTSISIQTGIDVVLYGYEDYLGIESQLIKIPVYDMSENGTDLKNIRMSAREFIAGLSLLLGGNAIERNGKIYITSLGSLYDLTTVFTESNYYIFERNKKTYTPNPVILSYQPYVFRTLDGGIVYTSGDKLSKNMTRVPVNGKIQYEININCDWIGVNAQDGFLAQTSFSYNPAEIEFSGYHSSLYAGNIIRVSEGQNEYQVMCGVVGFEWDGGLITKVSSVYSAENNMASTRISTSSNASTYSQIIAQINDVMTFKGVYADFVSAQKVITDELIAKNVEITGTLTAHEGKFQSIEADNVKIKGNLSVLSASLETLQAKAITTENLAAQNALLGFLNTTEANIKYADIRLANIDTANIDKAKMGELFAELGILKTAVIENGKITGELGAIKVSANNITTGRLDAGEIEVVNLNAANITVGQINGTQIASGAVDMTKLGTDISNWVSETDNDVSKALSDAGLANEKIDDVFSIVNGKTTSYYQAFAPNGGTYSINDIWFDTDDGYKMYYWNGSTWLETQYGSSAISANAVTSEKIAASAVIAGKIATGAVTAGTIAASAVTTETIAANAITATHIQTGAVNADKIAANAIKTEHIQAGAITGDKIQVNEALVEEIFSKNITATGTITGGKFVGGSFEGVTGSFAGEIIAASGKIGFMTVGSNYLSMDYGSKYGELTISSDKRIEMSSYNDTGAGDFAKYSVNQLELIRKEVYTGSVINRYRAAAVPHLIRLTDYGSTGTKNIQTNIRPGGIETPEVTVNGYSTKEAILNSVRAYELNIGAITINNGSPYSMSLDSVLNSLEGKLVGVALKQCWPHSTWNFSCIALLQGTTLYIATTTTQLYTVSVAVFYTLK